MSIIQFLVIIIKRKRRILITKERVCTVCGYVYEGENIPEKCPQCGVSVSKFKEQVPEGIIWACEREVGVVQGAPEGIMMDLRTNFEGGCSEVGMCPAVSRVAHREGYPEIGICWVRIALEETEHAAKSTELLDKIVTSSTKKNLEIKVVTESGATADKFGSAERTKALSLGAARGIAYEMAKDETRCGKTFEDLLGRHFG